MELDRELVRRMARAYIAELTTLINDTDRFPGGDWALDDLQAACQLRNLTFLSDKQTVTF
jgi:hypothetical protein